MARKRADLIDSMLITRKKSLQIARKTNFVSLSYIATVGLTYPTKFCKTIYLDFWSFFDIVSLQLLFMGRSYCCELSQG